VTPRDASTPCPPLTLRRAQRSDVPTLVALLADDAIGARRESNTVPLPQSYFDAFEAIDRDPNQQLLVALLDGEIAGTLQLTFVPSLSHRGRWRALIEGVRVAARWRSAGIGRQMFGQVIALSRQRGCRMVQLTTDKSRADAIRFYERLGFVASHEGMKLHLGALP
jgi:ribosomal protein S18 acetylase RimI-like enzyme